MIRLLEKQGPRGKAQFLVNAVLHYINCPEAPDNAIPQTVDRSAIVCDGRPFCGKGELRPGLTAGADRAAFDRVLEEFCRRVPGTVTVSYEQTDRQYAESEAQIRLLAWGLILFIGLIGILNIINTVYTNIHTRITENGIQRAMGMSAGSLYRVFLWEGFYYGISAAVIGCITGYIGTVFVEAGAADVLRLTAVPVVPMACASLFAIGACILATCIPLRKISRMSIVDSIELVE
mgnify:FL=1